MQPRGMHACRHPVHAHMLVDDVRGQAKPHEELLVWTKDEYGVSSADAHTAALTAAALAPHRFTLHGLHLCQSAPGSALLLASLGCTIKREVVGD